MRAPVTIAAIAGWLIAAAAPLLAQPAAPDGWVVFLSTNTARCAMGARHCPAAAGAARRGDTDACRIRAPVERRFDHRPRRPHR